MSLAAVFLGALRRRRTSTLFSFLAIVLGVALGMAVQAIHEAALQEFGRGTRALAGSADLEVVGPASGFDEAVYEKLAADPAVAEAMPLVEIEARLPGRDDELRLLGVDIFTLARVTPQLLPHPAAGEERLAALAEHAVFLSPAAQDALGLQNGATLVVQAGIRSVRLRLAGSLPGVAAGQKVGVIDIASAQTLFDRIGRLTRIDLKLAPSADDEARRRLQAALPAGVEIVEPEAGVEQMGQLSRAYRVNLGMLAAIALLTGGFLVFSAQTVSVARRRTEFAFLRALGLERGRLMRWLLAEGAVVGLLGGIIGVALGHGLAWGALRLLGGDLGAGYFADLQPQLEFEPGWSAVYAVLGLISGIGGAWVPARQAAAIAPAQALKAADEAALPAGNGAPRLGLVLLASAAAICRLPPLQGLPLGGYAAVALLLAGSVLLLPLAAAVQARLLPSRVSVPWRLARARLAGTPGYAVVAAAGVLTSVALAAAMAIMVTSFRDSVDEWLAQMLPADLYLRAGDPRSGAFLDPELQKRIAAAPGVAGVSFSRHDTLRLDSGTAPLALIARPLAPDARSLPLIARSAAAGGDRIWISEAMADQSGWRPGQRVSLPLAGARHEFLVAGIWRDYARQYGAVALDLAAYRRMTQDWRVSDAAITLAPGADAERVAGELLALAPSGSLEVTHPGEIRRKSLAIFDRSFAVTYLLEGVAIFIGLAGVGASFAALAAARRKEFGMLRHIGVGRTQIGWMLAVEGGLVAATGVLTGLLAGAAIGLVLIEVVNRQSFHWSMDLHMPWAPLALFALAMVLLAGLAAVAAGRHAMHRGAIMAVREDW